MAGRVTCERHMVGRVTYEMDMVGGVTCDRDTAGGVPSDNFATFFTKVPKVLFKIRPIDPPNPLVLFMMVSTSKCTDPPLKWYFSNKIL